MRMIMMMMMRTVIAKKTRMIRNLQQPEITMATMPTRVTLVVTQTTAMIIPMMAIIAKVPTLIMSPKPMFK